MAFRAFVVLLCVVLLAKASLSASPQEIQALNDLFTATNGLTWINNTNWTGGDPCLNSWFGVMCSAGNVISVALGSNHLVGTIPDSIGLLSNLQTLDLNTNYLSGSIPTSVGNLTSLQYLKLSSNTFDGSFPVQVSNLTNLSRLDLGSTGLKGELPDIFGGMPKLLNLDLSFNSLSGEIPPSIFNPPPNSFIDLGGNKFNSIPWDKITNMTGLSTSTLFLESNNIGGSLSHQVYWPYYISLVGNNIEGTLPEYDPSIDSPIQMALYLAVNSLTGNLPESLAQNTNMTSLDVSGNKGMKGVIPDAFVNMTSLRMFSFNDTHLTCPDSDAWTAFESAVTTSCGFTSPDDGFHIPVYVYVIIAMVVVLVVAGLGFLGYRFVKNKKRASDFEEI